MEDSFDFLIDYENLPKAPEIPDTLETQDPEEEDLYEEIINGSKKTFRCTFSGCGKIFKFKSEIVRHTIIHQKDRPYSCTYAGCKKAFKRADALENHMRIHAGVLPFQCNLPGCDRKFATKAALRYHQIRHKNNRVFKCEFESCKKTFLTASQLKQHHKAYNFHRNCPALMPEEEKTVMEAPEQTKKEDEIEIPEEILDQSSKLNESIQWEMRSQENEEEDIKMSKQEKFKNIIKHILTENKILKQKLEDCEKRNTCTVERNENKILRQKLEECERRNGSCRAKPSYNDDLAEFSKMLDSSSFFDNDELKFLDFLKGRDDEF